MKTHSENKKENLLVLAPKWNQFYMDAQEMITWLNSIEQQLRTSDVNSKVIVCIITVKPV